MHSNNIFLFKGKKFKIIDFFYNTIGLVDSIIVKMVVDLLNINMNEYKIVNLFRNGFVYCGTNLVISLDNKIFIDVRVNINSKNKSFIEGANSFINIFNNTYGLKYYDYKYIMVNFCNLIDGILYDKLVFESNYSYYRNDNFSIYLYNYKEAYYTFKKNKNIRWISLLYVSSYSELDNILGNDLITDEEKKCLYNLLSKYNGII